MAGFEPATSGPSDRRVYHCATSARLAEPAGFEPDDTHKVLRSSNPPPYHSATAPRSRAQAWRRGWSRTINDERWLGFRDRLRSTARHPPDTESKRSRSRKLCFAALIKFLRNVACPKRACARARQFDDAVLSRRWARCANMRTHISDFLGVAIAQRFTSRTLGRSLSCEPLGFECFARKAR